MTDMTIADGFVVAVRDAVGDCLEIAVEVDVSSAREFGVKVALLAGRDGTDRDFI